MKEVSSWKVRFKALFKSLWKRYSVLAFIGNILVAISLSGLSVLGVLSDLMTTSVLIGGAVSLGLLGLIGRFIHQDLEDGKTFIEEFKEEDKDGD